MENTENLPPPLLCGTQTLTCSPASPRKAGCVYMIQGRRKVRVRLSVHSGQFDRFIIVSQDKVLCRDSGFINLRNCTVREAGDKGFEILPRGCDGPPLRFVVTSSQEVNDWLQALNHSHNPLSPLRSALSPKHQQQSPLKARRRSGMQMPPPMLPALEEE